MNHRRTLSRFTLLYSCFAPGSNLSSGGTRASSPVSAASARSAPSAPWYTSRARRAPTYHQFFFLSQPRFGFRARPNPSPRRARPAATPGSTSAGSRGRRTAPSRATPPRAQGYVAAALATSSRGGSGGRGASASAAVSPRAPRVGDGRAVLLVVPTSTRSGASGAMYGDPRTPGAPSGQPFRR